MRDAIQLVEYGPEFGQQGLSDRRPDLRERGRRWGAPTG